jgi:hypothetical protein
MEHWTCPTENNIQVKAAGFLQRVRGCMRFANGISLDRRLAGRHIGQVYIKLVQT